jgi:hypothetical protein
VAFEEFIGYQFHGVVLERDTVDTVWCWRVRRNKCVLLEIKRKE